MIRRGRVAVGKESDEGMPKSRRSRRDLPLPAELSSALNGFKTRQQAEAEAFGTRWSDDRLIAVGEDGSPIRHEWYSDEFQRLRKRAGLRRIHLKGLRNTSVSLMLAGGMPVHVVAAWHGHDPAVVRQVRTHRWLSGHVFNFLVRRLGVEGVVDSQCGFKLFRGPVAEALFPLVGTDGFGFDVELLYVCHRAGLRMLEYPVRWNDVEGSKVNVVRDTRRMINELGQIRRNARRGVYKAKK